MSGKRNVQRSLGTCDYCFIVLARPLVDSGKIMVSNYLIECTFLSSDCPVVGKSFKLKK